MWILSGSRQRHPTTTSTLWWHCRCRSASAYSSDNKCALSSQLTPISEGRSPIRHLGRRLVAGSSAPKFRWYIKKFNSPFNLHRRVFISLFQNEMKHETVTSFNMAATCGYKVNVNRHAAIHAWFDRQLKQKPLMERKQRTHRRRWVCVCEACIVDDSTVLMSHCVVGPVD